MTIWLTFLTMAATVLLAAVLVSFLGRITAHLDSIGTGEESSLAKITWGVRAIETETAAIAPEVTRLNGQLTAAAGGLRAIDEGLLAIAGAASRQNRYT